MKYFEIEIYDGKPFKEIYIDENLTFEEHWWLRTEDITYIEYNFDDFSFCVDVGWYNLLFERNEKHFREEGHFRTSIMEGPRTEGEWFFFKVSMSIEQLRIDMQEAVNLIQRFKMMSFDEIMKNRIDYPSAGS